MKRKLVVSICLITIMAISFWGRPIYAAGPSVKIYVYPAITNANIIPTTSISSQYLSNNINISGSPGEYRTASFVINSTTNISPLNITNSALTNSLGNTIAGSAIDIRTVKSWYQAGLAVNDVSHKILTPELLLKDDSLIKVENNENYIKLTNGSYTWISDPTPSTDRWGSVPITTMPIQDSSSLQPINIVAGNNQQFWITLEIPSDSISGNYSGTITLSSSSMTIGTLNLALEVFPINLSTPSLIYSIYYLGRLGSQYPSGGIGDSYKNETQLTSELQDLIEHGITNPTCDQKIDNNLLEEYLSIRNGLGLGNQPLYYRGLRPEGNPSINDVQDVVALSKKYGIPAVYFYGLDEAAGTDLTNQRSSWEAIRAAGGKTFVAGYTADQYPPGTFEAMGDILDLFISRDTPDPAQAAKWHSVDHQIFSYANPQLGLVLPETYRRNYGLLLWQKDYDGAMDWAYQCQFGNIWNDFDDPAYRDEVMAYPTANGVVDTIQWEGFREGVNDVRYLTTLKNTITTAKAAGEDTSSAETWLANLKGADLSKVDLDSVRSQMIDYILTLQVKQNNTQLVSIAITPSNPSIVANGTQTFTAQGYDGNHIPISGLTYTWLVSNLQAGNIESDGIFTAGKIPGTYPNVIQVTANSVTSTTSITVARASQSYDINQDGHVNVLDLILIGQNMGKSGTPGWIPEDVNKDGVINVLDSILVGQNSV